ncbi:GGDEF domain-containing protein [Kushneria sinocarnis]|uniref:GGDEF domain-containing protein n=1 Tax=Kushneria sinocarnis TaxID=595502 RepID=UPI001472CB3F|nr:diguanylate cyclase [Kushneria sinocarnis]
MPLLLSLLSLLAVCLEMAFADDSRYLLGGTTALVAFSLILRRLQCPRSARLVSLPVLVLLALFVLSFLIPDSWIGYERWAELFDAWLGDGEFYALRPSLLISLTLILLVLPSLLFWRPHLIAPLLCMVAVLFSVTQLFEQLIFDLNEDSGLTPMSGLALALLLLAEAIDLHRQLGRYRRPIRLAKAGALLVVVITLALWHFQNGQNLYQVNHLALVTGDRLSELMGRMLAVQNDAMQRFSKGWQNEPGVPEENDWALRGQLLLQDFPDIAAIGWFDRERRLQRLVNRGSQQPAGMADNPAVKQALQQVFGYGQQGSAGVFDTAGEQRSIGLYFPVDTGDQRPSRGAVAFTLSLSRLFHQLEDRMTDTNDYLVTIHHDRQLLFRTGRDRRLSEDRYCNLITLGGNSFTLCTQPTMARLFAERTTLPALLLLTGLAFALMLYLVMYYHQRLRSKHSGVVNANRRLRNEVEARIALQTEVEWLARHDELTQLPNRRYFMEWTSERLDSRGGAVMLIDIDHFKTVNDQLGHARGDHYLKCVAEVARRPIEACGGLLARYGGEEFVACLPGVEEDEVVLCAERIRREVQLLELEQPHTGEWLTVSIGIDCAVGLFDIGRLIETADRALYRAKQAGRDRVMTR